MIKELNEKEVCGYEENGKICGKKKKFVIEIFRISTDKEPQGKIISCCDNHETLQQERDSVVQCPRCCKYVYEDTGDLILANDNIYAKHEEFECEQYYCSKCIEEMGYTFEYLSDLENVWKRFNELRG